MSDVVPMYLSNYIHIKQCGLSKNIQLLKISFWQAKQLGHCLMSRVSIIILQMAVHSVCVLRYCIASNYDPGIYDTNHPQLEWCKDVTHVE